MIKWLICQIVGHEWVSGTCRYQDDPRPIHCWYCKRCLKIKGD